jgi:predicted ribonuclease YlaK
MATIDAVAVTWLHSMYGLVAVTSPCGCRLDASLSPLERTSLSSTTRSGKIFVLDTNVILHDSSCITQFEEHDVVIPITVLEELDQFKKGNDAVNFHAREFARTLDDLSGDRIFNGGLPLGPKKGKVRISMEKVFQIDHPYLDTESNGLSYLIEKMQGQGLYAHVNLEKGERSQLAELASNIL